MRLARLITIGYTLYFTTALTCLTLIDKIKAKVS